MKCRICGQYTQYIEQMARHYRIKHPAAMKRKTRKGKGYVRAGRSDIKQKPRLTDHEIEVLKSIARGL